MFWKGLKPKVMLGEKKELIESSAQGCNEYKRFESLLVHMLIWTVSLELFLIYPGIRKDSTCGYLKM